MEPNFFVRIWQGALSEIRRGIKRVKSKIKIPKVGGSTSDEYVIFTIQDKLFYPTWHVPSACISYAPMYVVFVSSTRTPDALDNGAVNHFPIQSQSQSDVEGRASFDRYVRLKCIAVLNTRCHIQEQSSILHKYLCTNRFGCWTMDLSGAEFENSVPILQDEWHVWSLYSTMMFLEACIVAIWIYRVYNVVDSTYYLDSCLLDYVKLVEIAAIWWRGWGFWWWQLQACEIARWSRQVCRENGADGRKVGRLEKNSWFKSWSKKSRWKLFMHM